MSPMMFNRMRGMGWGCVDLLTRACVLLMPGLVLGLLAAILGTLILLDGTFSLGPLIMGRKS
jgi:hypothetical protein